MYEYFRKSIENTQDAESSDVAESVDDASISKQSNQVQTPHEENATSAKKSVSIFSSQSSIETNQNESEPETASNTLQIADPS